MTGFGRGSTEAAEQELKIEVAISSVNRKNLDAVVSGPREWGGLDQCCNEWLRGSYERGRVNVQFKVESTAGKQSGLIYNTEAMDEVIECLRGYADERELPFEVDGRLLLDLAKTLKDNSGLPDWREIEMPIKTAFDQALADINSMRTREGEALAADLSRRIDRLDQLHRTIAKHAANAVGKYRDALLERLKQLGLELELNDERVLKEIAIFADRSDISEELTRLQSHFVQFREFLQSEKATGRKMNFLCQEINREFNTIGSKATRIEITRTVIESKNTLERIREQVQNVE